MTSDDDVRKYIIDGGHELAGHCLKHQDLGTLRSVEGVADVINCRIELEKRYKTIVRGMAYSGVGVNILTNGNTYENIKEYLKQADIAYARSALGDNTDFEIPTDWHRWIPSVYHKNENVMDYVDAFLKTDCTPEGGCLGARLRPRLFYMWGHSYEFDVDNNWDLLEDILKKLSGDKDSWFASNIEIYNYVKAYNSLVYSADGMIIHNPTAVDVWLVAVINSKAKTFCVKSGETITLE